MADDEISNSITTHILTLKDQVLKWAAPIKHDNSDGELYGKASNTNFGHVKLKQDMNTLDEHPVSSSGIASYIINKINDAVQTVQEKLHVDETIDNDIESHKVDEKYRIPTSKAVSDKIKQLQSKINIINSIDANTTHKNEANLYNIPTGKAVWNALSNYKNLLQGVSLAMPQSYTGNINNLITPGYYYMNHDITKAKSFAYGGENIYYTNGLVTVQKQSNRIIQHVCTTTKILASNNANNYTYKINGSEYKRYGKYDANGKMDWHPWHLAYKPYTKTSRVKKTFTNVDTDSVTVLENTQGFIIKWKQTGTDEQYKVHQSLYEYADVCEFSPALPIANFYVFGNLIGRMDIRITPTKMQIRSNVAPGGRIIGMDVTFFVPRNQ